MIVQQLSPEGYFVGSIAADESPLEPGVWLIPGGCVEAEAPSIPEGKRAKWVDGWILEDIPPPPVPGAPPVRLPVCSPWQIRKALNAAGLRHLVEDAIAASSDITRKDGWEFASEFVCTDPFVIDMGGVLGMDEAGIRAFIEYASSL